MINAIAFIINYNRKYWHFFKMRNNCDETKHILCVSVPGYRSANDLVSDNVIILPPTVCQSRYATQRLMQDKPAYFCDV